MLKAVVLFLSVIRSGGRLLPLLPFVGASGQEFPHEAAVLEQMLYGKGMVWAWPLEHFFEVVRSALRGLLTTLAVSSGHE